MRQLSQAPLSAAAACTVLALLATGPALAQGSATPNGPQPSPRHSLDYNPANVDAVNEASNANILQVPLVNVIPGAVSLPKIQNPMANDPESAQRGMSYFNSMNCVGCHAPNGAGGMGPTLSDSSTFKFGSEPARLYAVIAHGAPQGMPAWGSVLPNNVIWDIISYIESINKDPAKAWGDTFNLSENMPKTEQVPAEFKQTTNPWDYLQKFSNGKKPTQRNPTSAENEPNNAGSQ